jgi:hypothetical protein
MSFYELTFHRKRFAIALSYLEQVLQRYDEIHALYFEDFAKDNLDPLVEDAKIFISGANVNEIPKVHMGPKARLVQWKQKSL